MLAATGQRRREGERVGAGHDELAVGEVDEPQDAEDEADPDRHQRVDGAEADGVDQRLRVDRGDDAHERYAAIIRSVSSASAGVRVIRSSPFASTYVRSANATVRCARCSTSRTLTPRSRISASACEDDVDDRRREPERRLVEQEHVRIGDERPPDRELLLLAARERSRLAAAELGEDREELVGGVEGGRRRRRRDEPRARAAGSPRR